MEYPRRFDGIVPLRGGTHRFAGVYVVGDDGALLAEFDDAPGCRASAPFGTPDDELLLIAAKAYLVWLESSGRV